MHFGCLESPCLCLSFLSSPLCLSALPSAWGPLTPVESLPAEPLPADDPAGRASATEGIALARQPLPGHLHDALRPGFHRLQAGFQAEWAQVSGGPHPLSRAPPLQLCSACLPSVRWPSLLLLHSSWPCTDPWGAHGPLPSPFPSRQGGCMCPTQLFRPWL